MKKMIIILSLVLVSSGIKSQGYTANLDFFVGTWTYTNEVTNEEFTLKLRKSVYINPLDKYQDEKACLVGAYTYMLNGDIITDTMDEFGSDKHALKMPLMATNFVRNISKLDSQKLRLTFKDRKYNKYTLSSSLEIVSTSPAKIRWTLTEDEGEEVYSPGETIKPNGFSVPVNMVLTKVSE